MPVRPSSPSVSRNRDPILAVLVPLCERARDQATHGRRTPFRILEVASGTGEHADYFARAMPHVVWQPSERDPDALENIASRMVDSGLPNVLPPLRVDARWPFELPVDFAIAGVVCINMIHITPWESTEGLFDNAKAWLAPGGFLLLYGPFRRGGKHTAESNARFDAELRVRDTSWGVRDLDDVSAYAASRGFTVDSVIEMPRDNLSVVFRAGTDPSGAS